MEAYKDGQAGPPPGPSELNFTLFPQLLPMRERPGRLTGCSPEGAQRGEDGPDFWLSLVFMELKTVLLARKFWSAGHSPHLFPMWLWPTPQDRVRCSDARGDFLATSRSMPESWR